MNHDIELVFRSYLIKVFELEHLFDFINHVLLKKNLIVLLDEASVIQIICLGISLFFINQNIVCLFVIWKLFSTIPAG